MVNIEGKESRKDGEIEEVAQRQELLLFQKTHYALLVSMTTLTHMHVHRHKYMLIIKYIDKTTDSEALTELSLVSKLKVP